MTKVFRRCAASTILVFIASDLAAQNTVEYPASFDEPMPLYETALGPFTRAVTTSSPEAQAYFNQGTQQSCCV